MIRELEKGELFVAGIADNSGQKVHNLIEAVLEKGGESEVYVFADSDARPDRDWLKALIEPLFQGEVMVTTGYRWFAPEKFGFANELRSAWNASITSSLGENQSSNFCWGGSMAIRRSDFEKLDIISEWRGTVSDDFVMTNAVKEVGGGIEFVPRCLNASTDSTTIPGLLEFATRQMKITKTYSPGHFKISVIGSVLFCLSFYGGLLTLPFLEGAFLFAVSVLLSLIWLLGTGKSLVRYNAVRKCLPTKTSALGYISQALLWPLATLVFLIANLGAILSNRIVWRGIGYELVSDKEIRIER